MYLPDLVFWILCLLPDVCGFVIWFYNVVWFDLVNLMLCMVLLCLVIVLLL